MSTVVTRFEVELPLDSGNGTSQDLAIEAFKTGLAALVSYSFSQQFTVDSATGTISTFELVFGYLTSGQTTSALSLLNTLNTALGFNVVCSAHNVTLEP